MDALAQERLHRALTLEQLQSLNAFLIGPMIAATVPGLLGGFCTPSAPSNGLRAEWNVPLLRTLTAAFDVKAR